MSLTDLFIEDNGRAPRGNVADEVEAWALQRIRHAMHGIEPARPYLERLYRDWVNNYISLDGFADAHGVDNITALALIDEGRRIHGQDTERG